MVFVRIPRAGLFRCGGCDSTSDPVIYADLLGFGPGCGRVPLENKDDAWTYNVTLDLF